MWTGDYGFFDYKKDITTYDGQDYMAPIQFIMAGVGIALVIALLILFRNMKKKNIKKIFLVLGIFMTLMYLIKTSWETFFDFKYDGKFNIWILPFDTCSLIMPTLIIAGLSKEESKAERYSTTFIATIGLVGGVANMIFLRGLKYYPMFSFGGLYSYFWHINMIFAALFVPATNFVKFKWADILNSMLVMVLAAVIVIPFNYIAKTDFMMFKEAGGVPLIEDLASNLIKNKIGFLVPIIMLLAYQAMAAIFTSIYIGCQSLASKLKQ